MEVCDVVMKMKRLFKEIFEDENYDLSKYYSEKILEHLEDNSSKDVCVLIESPFLLEELLNYRPKLVKSKESVQIFAMNVFTIMIKKEAHFLLFRTHLKKDADSFASIISDISTFTEQFNIAYVKQMLAHLLHDSGANWLVRNQVWEHVLHPKLYTKSICLQDISIKFMTRLIYKLNEMDDFVHFTEVIEYQLMPLNNNAYFDDTKVLDTDTENSLIVQPIKPYLKSLLHFIEEEPKDLSFKEAFQKSTCDFTMLAVTLDTIIKLAKDAEIIDLTLKLQQKLYFYYFTCQNANDAHIAHFYNNLVVLAQKRNVDLITNYVVNSIIYWSKRESKNSLPNIQETGRNNQLRDQFVPVLVTPLMTYFYKIWFIENSIMENSENYLMKMSTDTHEHIIGVAYHIRDLFESYDSNHMHQVAVYTIKQLTRLKGHLNSKQAGLIYQSLYFILKLHIFTDDKDNITFNAICLSACHFKLISLIMDVIKMLLIEHNVNCYENYEIILLHTTLADILKLNILPPKLQVQTLDLIDIGIQKFLPPDLALLTNRNSGALKEVITIITNYMENEEWEIRDSALNLLLTCTDIAYIKYPPFQQLISERNVMVSCVDYALNDSNHYVQATGLKCLAAASKIDKIWKNVQLANAQLLIKLNNIMKNHTEGIVRKEAATVLSEIYVNRMLSEQITQFLYNSMAPAAMDDYHWEVQLVALNFWAKVIQNQLTDKGMIDGSFPTVTFSRQKRKIITLDETEIKKQLTIILHDLSSIGCLTVLNKCLKDNDYSLEVMTKAYYIAKDFINILEQYNLYNFSEFPIYNVAENIDDSKVNKQQRGNRDEVIEMIVNTKLNDLDIEMMENNHNQDDELPNININDFIDNFRNINQHSLIEAKKCNNLRDEDLNSILDEIDYKWVNTEYKMCL